MVVNKAKSAILNLNSRVPEKDPNANYNGYPKVCKYRYLGTLITNQFTLKSHLQECARKVTNLRIQLLPVLLRGHFKLNVNLFKVFAMPQYRLLLVLSQFAGSADMERAELALRRHFKAWNMLPQSTSTTFIQSLIGNIRELGEQAVKVASIKRKAR